MLVLDKPTNKRSLKQAAANLQRHSPFANIEWVSLDQLHARCEEWSPKRKALVAASCDQDGVDLFYNID